MPYKQQDERVCFSLPLMNNKLKSQIYENLISSSWNNLKVFHLNWIVYNILMGLAFKKFLQILQKKGYVKKNISPASSVILVKTLLKLSF